HLWATDTPINLAVFRITVGLVILYAHSIHTASRAAASLHAAVRTPPYGLQSILAAVPITPVLADLSYTILLIATVTGIVGLASRASFASVSLAGLYLWGIGQSAGHVFHYHHLLWFSALLAAGASG